MIFKLELIIFFEKVKPDFSPVFVINSFLLQKKFSGREMESADEV